MGYGERPFRVLYIALTIVLVSALLYPVPGILPAGGGEPLTYPPLLAEWPGGLIETGRVLAESLYFSVITFTTLGYGDVAPAGWGKLVATAEAASGLLLTVLLAYHPRPCGPRVVGRSRARSRPRVAADEPAGPSQVGSLLFARPTDRWPRAVTLLGPPEHRRRLHRAGVVQLHQGDAQRVVVGVDPINQLRIARGRAVAVGGGHSSGSASSESASLSAVSSAFFYTAKWPAASSPPVTSGSSVSNCALLTGSLSLDSLIV